MSLGSRSGVNWMRRTEQSTDRASALASIVLPTPGTSSISRWPSASSTVIARLHDLALALDDALDGAPDPRRRVGQRGEVGLVDARGRPPVARGGPSSHRRSRGPPRPRASDPPRWRVAAPAGVSQVDRSWSLRLDNDFAQLLSWTIAPPPGVPVRRLPAFGARGSWPAPARRRRRRARAGPDRPRVRRRPVRRRAATQQARRRPPATGTRPRAGRPESSPIRPVPGDRAARSTRVQRRRPAEQEQRRGHDRAGRPSARCSGRPRAERSCGRRASVAIPSQPPAGDHRRPARRATVRGPPTVSTGRRGSGSAATASGCRRRASMAAGPPHEAAMTSRRARRGVRAPRRPVSCAHLRAQGAHRVQQGAAEVALAVPRGERHAERRPARPAPPRAPSARPAAPACRAASAGADLGLAGQHVDDERPKPAGAQVAGRPRGRGRRATGTPRRRRPGRGSSARQVGQVELDRHRRHARLVEAHRP